MRFLSPDRLWLLLAVLALLAVYLYVQRRRRAYAVRFTNLALLESVAPRHPGWRRHLPAAAMLLMLASLVGAFARPTADARVPLERATVVLAIDVSSSMMATDVSPSRIEAAKTAATAFVSDVPERVNIGLVSFAGSASVLVTPTDDREPVRNAIRRLELAPRTAIGEGVFASLDALRSLPTEPGQEPPPARIILMSDGFTTSGRANELATTAAAEAGVPVSTIAYGTDDGTISIGGQTIPVPVDPDALRVIADRTGGSFAEAGSAEELREVYADIGSSVGFRTERREVTAWFVGVALVLGCLAAAGSMLWSARLP